MATAKADHDITVIFSVDVMETGRKIQGQFIEDSVKDSNRLSRPIKRQKIEYFATQAGRFKVSSASNKNYVAVTMTRDLFGSIFFNALLPKVNMG